jgi:glycine cleavage system aminomethyltransferase T
VLMPLLLETDAPPSPGAKLETGETNAAEITSAAYSPALKKVVALGYVKTEYARPHEPLPLGPIHAEVATPTGR